MDGGADVSKSLVKGPTPSTQLHDMAEPWPRASQRRAAWPSLAELAGRSAAGASGGGQLAPSIGRGRLAGVAVAAVGAGFTASSLLSHMSLPAEGRQEGRQARRHKQQKLLVRLIT